MCVCVLSLPCRHVLRMPVLPLLNRRVQPRLSLPHSFFYNRIELNCRPNLGIASSRTRRRALHGYFREADDQRGNCGDRIDPATRYGTVRGSLHFGLMAIATTMTSSNCYWDVGDDAWTPSSCVLPEGRTFPKSSTRSAYVQIFIFHLVSSSY